VGFLYPFSISVYRPTPTDGIGALPYEGLEKIEEQKVLSNVRANIADTREARPVTSGIPGATMFRSIYRIVFRADKGSVNVRDIIVDDEGSRYQAMGVTWGHLGYSILAERLEV
jgi:hypothetical protein